MVTLRLTPDEAQVLASALESYLSDLRMEIARTDGRAFRERLKERKAILRRVLDELGAGASP